MKHWLKECSKKSIQFSPDFFLWLQFNPLVQEESIPFEFRHQSQLILGQAYVLLFEVQDITFAFLPLIQQKIWIPQLDERGKPEQLRAEVTRLLQEMLRAYSVDEAIQKEEFIQSICEKKKIYLQEVDLSIPTDLYYNPLHPSSTNSDEFSFIREAVVFHGYQELPKVASNLNQNINLSLQLANGTHVKMDSISFALR